ncbi:MAG: hypothetical protein ACI9SI_000412 [Polaribacter sp.]|jgi:hypothetical protein
MILIADGGSTKADWIAIDSKEEGIDKKVNRLYNVTSGDYATYYEAIYK